jgi:hypothetical protein
VARAFARELRVGVMGLGVPKDASLVSSVESKNLVEHQSKSIDVDLPEGVFALEKRLFSGVTSSCLILL